MKAGIHPKYEENSVTCSCGNNFDTRSTKKYSHIEVCSKCHPAYTGIQKGANTAGKIDQFNKRFGSRTIGAKKAKPDTTSAA